MKLEVVTVKGLNYKCKVKLVLSMAAVSVKL